MMVNFLRRGAVKEPFFSFLFFFLLFLSSLADAIFIDSLRLLTFVTPISLRCDVAYSIYRLLFHFESVVTTNRTDDRLVLGHDHERPSSSLQACICLKAFLLPLLIPRLRCDRPLRSCSLNTRKLGSSPPFSIPAPNLSTPLRVSFEARFCLRCSPPTMPSSSSSSSPAAWKSDRLDLRVGTQETSTDPSPLRRMCSSSRRLRCCCCCCCCRAEADRRWPKEEEGSLLAVAVRPEAVVDACA